MTENTYTEGVCEDGAAILHNGKQLTVSEILERLNKHNEMAVDAFIDWVDDHDANHYELHTYREEYFGRR
ncbi:MAG: hypothetical protein COA90_04135 [Gammaproteobacteria bacterium]|nr:MAG: hypothetical protein COA90_04135 [Gammaproteobacteria bacterium]